MSVLIFLFKGDILCQFPVASLLPVKVVTNSYTISAAHHFYLSPAFGHVMRKGSLEYAVTISTQRGTGRPREMILDGLTSWHG